ncbi:FRG domain-containing protein [Burkholderia sp. AU31624]|uniref:FRG domain-containing protein n=1 Tax=Burkholderia sp. AU31624 TaxID=2879629 RepID=UPI001CF0D940|nr:FRG domain-containing protein [Burkholderia sp. AU31624]MCA8256101.1 FRG domain-containing protein [Burkholderia sp. AU31624]
MKKEENMADHGLTESSLAETVSGEPKKRSYRHMQHLRDVCTLAEFLHEVTNRVDDPLWPEDPQVLFRGHRNAEHTLIPGIARPQVFDLTPGIEQSMLSDFKRRALPYLNFPHAELSDLEWLAIAQHHGMATRLLDWSGSALAALWFAVQAPAKPGSHGAVWMLTYDPPVTVLSPNSAQPFRVRRTGVVYPSHVSPRITAQEGYFTLHRSYPGDNDTLRFPPLECEDDYWQRLQYVTIPAEAFARMRLDLAKAGVTPATLFPDLDGLARHMNGKYLFQQDERNHHLLPASFNAAAI